MNLQPVSENAGQNDDRGGWRNSHVIRFSQIDGAGIVYYPRYFEMLADSFPEIFALHNPALLETSFHHPARLGERLQLEAEHGPQPGELTVTGRSAGELCFRSRRAGLETMLQPAWKTSTENFVRQAEIHSWMTGADGRMHLGRSYELTAVLMEEWFADCLDSPFATLQSKDGALVPTVELQTQVRELPANGDTVHLSLVVLHVGRSSLGLGMAVARDGRLLLQTRQTIVFVTHQNGQLRSVPIPAHLLPRLNRQRVAAAG